MEEHPEQPKTRGRPRKNSLGGNDAGQSEVNIVGVAGVGEVGAAGTGLPASAEPAGQSPKLSFSELTAHVLEINRHDRRVSLVTHPGASGLIMSERWGNIRTEVGPAGYVLNTGERVEVDDAPVAPSQPQANGVPIYAANLGSTPEEKWDNKLRTMRV